MPLLNSFYPLKQKPSVSLEDILDFESNLSSKLPKEYVNFLKFYNGAKLSKTILKVKEGYTVISELFDLKTLYQTLNGYFDDFNVLTSKMLPIAIDAFGNIVCLSLKPESFGKIFFYDHETGLFLYISDNFNYFIESLIDKQQHDKKVRESDEEFANRLQELRKNSKFR